MSAEHRTAAADIVDEYARRFPDELARDIEDLAIDEIVAVVSERPAKPAAAVLERLRPDVAAATVERLPGAVQRQVLPLVDPVRMATSLALLDPTDREAVLRHLEPRTARELEDLLSYPPGTAGAIMDPRITAYRAELTVEEALDRLRKLKDRRVYNAYVVDTEGSYLGRVPIQDIVAAEPDQTLSELLVDAPVRVESTASHAEVVELLDAHRLLALPVVDFQNRLVGVIRHQALIDTVEQEATADLQSMVGASREERALSSVGFAVRKRLPWLEINLVTAFLAAAVVGLFEGTIARFTALAVLLPVVAGQSGNTGAQALAVTMRGLALREVRTRQWFRVASKEVRVAFFNGIAVALTTSAAVYVWSRSSGLALIICVSMVLSMVAAGLAGAIIPMALTALRQDPAQSSSIILTTVTDVVGFFSFLGIATVLAGLI
ncbi:MAG: magnesium transporter [Thermoanaerobaculales bacterium]|jgi:magnesium transporter|nr:magnesium transporter [Thermoanaerobaculales bacterium]